MQNRARVDAGANDVRAQMPGDVLMSQLLPTAITTAGDGSITTNGMLNGLITRSGPPADYADTLPTVAALCAACPQLSAGDAFSFMIQNGVAYVNTVTTNTGWTLTGTTTVIASNTREYLVRMTSTKATRVVSATTTNGDATLTAVSADDIKNLQPGMVASGTGIASGATILSLNPQALTIELSANCTATGTTVAVTFNPTATLLGVRTSAK